MYIQRTRNIGIYHFIRNKLIFILHLNVKIEHIENFIKNNENHSII